MQLLKNSGDFARYNRYFETMLEELDRTNLILNEFLMQAKNRIIDLQQNDLNQIIRDLYPFLKADAVMGEKTIGLELGKIPEIFLNKREIRQLIINLVHNRLEATPPGGNVKISTCWQGDEVILEVVDQGALAQDVLDKLGTQFYDDNDDSTCMELVICYGVATRHQASISVISNDSENCFQIRFKATGNI